MAFFLPRQYLEHSSWECPPTETTDGNASEYKPGSVLTVHTR
jgi:hypothetical protein